MSCHCLPTINIHLFIYYDFIISTFSTNILTRSALEKALNDWVIDISSENALNLSICDLMDLINKMRENYHTKPHVPSLMREVITRITRQNVPRSIKEKLYESRLRIRDEDTLNDCLQTINAVLMQWVGMKSTTRVRTVTLDTKSSADSTSAKPKKETPRVQAVDSASKPANPNSKGAAYPKKDKKGSKGGKSGGQAGADGNMPKGKSRNYAADGKMKKKPSFVAPWPENCPYLSKNGNSLSKEIETYFLGHCYKCGFSSHNAKDCIKYQDKGTVLTLCLTCRQGFHTECRSKRPDLVQDRLMKEVKKLIRKQDTNKSTIVWSPYSVPPPQIPAQPVQEESSDSE